MSPHAVMTLPVVPLEGFGYRMEPYQEDLKEALRPVLDCDAAAWQLFTLSGQGGHFDNWWRQLTNGMRHGTWICYAIRRLSDGQLIGTSSFLNIKPERETAEIGATFLHPEVRGTQANPAAKYLMLRHAFEHGARRVELLTDLRNVRSQAAIAKLGAVREGVLRRDRITWTGHVRDSVLYAITDLDWPEAQVNLSVRLGFSPAMD